MDAVKSSHRPRALRNRNSEFSSPQKSRPDQSTDGLAEAEALVDPLQSSKSLGYIDLPNLVELYQELADFTLEIESGQAALDDEISEPLIQALKDELNRLNVAILLGTQK